MMGKVLATPWRATVIGALLVALLLTAACGGSDTSDSGGASSGDDVVAQSNDDALADLGGGSDPDVPSISERKITLSATVRLRVDDIPTAVQQVEDIAAARAGFVSSSDVSIDSGEDEREQTATMKIRVPAASYTEVIRELRGIAARVDSESSLATEVTDEYTDLQSRLRNLEASEVRYLDLLNRAQTVDEILAVQDRVNSTRLEIEQVQGRLNVLNDLTALATIGIEMRLPPLVASSQNDGWAEEAVQTSWEATQTAVEVIGTITIATLFLLPWVLIPVLVVAVVWRLFGRRIAATMERISKI
jgi:hypothetical protein